MKKKQSEIINKIDEYKKLNQDYKELWHEYQTLSQIITKN